MNSKEILKEKIENIYNEIKVENGNIFNYAQKAIGWDDEVSKLVINRIDESEITCVIEVNNKSGFGYGIDLRMIRKDWFDREIVNCFQLNYFSSRIDDFFKNGEMRNYLKTLGKIVDWLEVNKEKLIVELNVICQNWEEIVFPKLKEIEQIQSDIKTIEAGEELLRQKEIQDQYLREGQIILSYYHSFYYSKNNSVSYLKIGKLLKNNKVEIYFPEWYKEDIDDVVWLKRNVNIEDVVRWIRNNNKWFVNYDYKNNEYEHYKFFGISFNKEDWTKNQADRIIITEEEYESLKKI